MDAPDKLDSGFVVAVVEDGVRETVNRSDTRAACEEEEVAGEGGGGVGGAWEGSADLEGLAWGESVDVRGGLAGGVVFYEEVEFAAGGGRGDGGVGAEDGEPRA